MMEIVEKQIFAACKWAHQPGYQAMDASTISEADLDGNAFAFKVINDDVSAAGIRCFSLQEKKDSDAQMTEDIRLHLEIYRHFPRICSIVHVFSPKLMYFSLLGESIPVYSKRHALVWPDEIRCIGASGDEGQDPVSSVISALEKTEINSRGIFLLDHNGAVVWDETPIKAIEAARNFEKIAAEAWSIQSAAKGKVRPLSPEQIRKYAEEKTEEDFLSAQRGKPGTEVTVKQLRNINLQMLEYFDSVCRQNGIRYSLTGGTLLGAVRHGGMIPWDDDVDVFLTRPEYEKLQAVFPDNEQYEFITRQKDPKFNYVFGRVIDKRTMVRYSPNTAAAGKGLSLDVCVVDGLPDSNRAIKKHLIHMRLLVRFRRATIQNPKGKRYREKGPVVVFLKRILCKVTSIDYWNRRIEKQMSKYPFDGGQWVGNFTSQYGSRELLHKSVFDDYYDVRFENLTCMICSGYDEYLTNIYRNYLSFPAKKKQVGHHICNAYWV